MKETPLQKKIRLAILALLFLCVFMQAGCFEKSLPPGIIASVNGEEIQLRTLQALMDSQSASLGTARPASVEEMRENYVNALCLAIAQTLVRQELATRGMALDKSEYVAFVDELKNDLAPDSLEEIMAASSISSADWEKQIQDYLAMEIFKNRILQPGIKIGLDEIKAFYQSHKKDFQLPATFSLCYGTSANKNSLLDWCAGSGENSPPADVLSQCLEVAETDLPERLLQIKNLSTGKCSAPFQEDGEWRVFLPLKKFPPGTVSPARAYALIERILLAEKQNEAFDKWLEDKISKSSILVAPPLNESLAKITEKRNE